AALVERRAQGRRALRRHRAHAARRPADRQELRSRGGTPLAQDRRRGRRDGDRGGVGAGRDAHEGPRGRPGREAARPDRREEPPLLPLLAAAERHLHLRVPPQGAGPPHGRVPPVSPDPEPEGRRDREGPRPRRPHLRFGARPMISFALALLLQATQADPPPPDPEIERKSFKVAEGFEVNLFAADPLVAKPIQMNFDARGRLWISTSSIYPMVVP